MPNDDLTREELSAILNIPVKSAANIANRLAKTGNLGDLGAALAMRGADLDEERRAKARVEEEEQRERHRLRREAHRPAMEAEEALQSAERLWQEQQDRQRREGDRRDDERKRKTPLFTKTYDL